jgi:hypothetical protein
MQHQEQCKLMQQLLHCHTGTARIFTMRSPRNTNFHPLRLARTAKSMSSTVVLSFQPPASFRADMRHTPAVPVHKHRNGKNKCGDIQIVCSLLEPVSKQQLLHSCLLLTTTWEKISANKKLVIQLCFHNCHPSLMVSVFPKSLHKACQHLTFFYRI